MIISKALRVVTSWLDGGQARPVAEPQAETALPSPSLDRRDIDSLSDAIYTLSRDLADTLELIRELKRELSLEAEPVADRLVA
jgi:hypothetical protein